MASLADFFGAVGAGANGPDDYAAYQARNAVKALGSNPDFQKADPATQQMMIATATGNPQVLQAAGQSQNMGNINLDSDPNALKRLQQMMTPEQLVNLRTNPMASGMFGGGGGNPLPSSPTNAAPGSSLSAPAPNGATQPTDNTQDPRNWNYLQSQVPAFYRNQVLDYAQGGELAKDVSPKDRTMIANWAHNFDPTFTELTGQQRSKTVNDFSPSGKSGQALTSVATGTKHLAQLAVTATQMNNKQLPGLNWAKNNLLGGTGNDAPTTFSSLVNTVAPEIAKAANSGGDTTDADRQAQRNDFNMNGSPSQLLAAPATKAALLTSKAEEMGNTYRKNMGPINPDFKAITDTTKQTLNDIQALHSMSRLDPQFKTPQSQQLIQRLTKAASLDDSQFMPQLHGEGSSALQTAKAAPPKTAVGSETKPSTISKDDALAELRKRGKVK